VSAGLLPAHFVRYLQHLLAQPTHLSDSQLRDESNSAYSFGLLHRDLQMQQLCDWNLDVPDQMREFLAYQ
jgi:hypothetical protein